MIVFLIGLPLVLGLSALTSLNLLLSSTDAFRSKREYSSLFITTTPDPLSGLVMMMSFRFFKLLMASFNIFGGFESFP